MKALDILMLKKVKARYKEEKRAWGLLSKRVLADWKKKKELRADLNKKMRRSESEIVKIVMYGCACENCGSTKTIEEIQQSPHAISCCPERFISVRKGVE